MMRECRICKRTNILSTVEVEEDGYTWEIQICNNCWVAIAAVAQKAMTRRLTALEERVEAIDRALRRSLSDVI